MSKGPSRRRFLWGAASAAASFGAAPMVFGQQKKGGGKAPKAKTPPKYSATNPSPYTDINVAFIGVGGRGGSNFEAIRDLGVNVVALCDTNVEQLAPRAYKHPNAATYSDFREMFAKEADKIDAVVVSTPDHTHAPAAMAAIRLGKHVYCEKPLTHDVFEVRSLVQAARDYGVATQMGNQGHSSEGSRVQVECIKAGVIGTVTEVHICTDRPIWPQGVHRPLGVSRIPDTLNWNAWLGPAALRPHNTAYLPFKWRGYWDFGTGALGDMGCHLMDAPYWALDLRDPVSIESTAEGTTEESAPKKSTVTYMFPERNGRPPVKVVWYDGGLLPPKDLTGDFPLPDSNNYMIYVGSSGTMAAALNREPVLVGDKDKKFQPPAKSIPRSVGHHEDFLIACHGGPPAGSNFDYAGPLSEMVVLGNLSLRLNKKIEWDAKTMSCPNAPEAATQIRRPYREGWTL